MADGLTHAFLQFVPPPLWVPHPCDFFFRKGGFGKGFVLAGVLSGSWNYNSDDELSNETYDQDGDVTAADGKTFSYDSQNEMLSMNGSAVQMVYDGDGNRVRKTANGVTTEYLVDDLNPTGLPQVMDELTNGVVTRTYTYGLQRISEDQIVNGAWTPSFYSYDGMGRVRQLTDLNGTVTDSYEYDAFGNLITSTGTTPNNYLYRGEQYDSDLGLYYPRARYYDPAIDRFLSEDPIGFGGGLNEYAYAYDDPINFFDPFGLKPPSPPPPCGDLGVDCPPNPPDVPVLKRGPEDCNGYHYVDPIRGAVEVTVKVGPEIEVGPLRAGFSLYKNLMTGQFGGRGEINSGAGGLQVDTMGGGGPEDNEWSASFLGFEQNFTTGEFRFNPSMNFGLQAFVGLEFSWNTQKVGDIGARNMRCGVDQ